MDLAPEPLRKSMSIVLTYVEWLKLEILKPLNESMSSAAISILPISVVSFNSTRISTLRELEDLEVVTQLQIISTGC